VTYQNLVEQTPPAQPMQGGGGLSVAGLRAFVRRVVKENYYLTCAAFGLLNYLEARRYKSGNIETKSGTLHSAFDAAVSVEYVREVFRDYKQYGDVTRFFGRVAEIGPGDNCGVGMLMRADGAASVDLVDRYYSARDPQRQAVVYEQLVASSPATAQIFAGVDLADESTFPGLTRYYGPKASAEEFFDTADTYDFIVSRAVMEHLYDPELALRRMATALRPGGLLLHKVDFRDHGMFTPNFHELKFLEVPDWLYSRMTRASGRPNRVLVHRYAAALKDSGLDGEILVTRLAGVGDITPHLRYEEIAPELRRVAEEFVESRRRSFAEPFRLVPARDLAVAGIFLVARKAR
jgi:SAM-dependent methyltransferase